MKYKNPITVSITSLLIAISFVYATWDINFWPTDTKAYYFDETVNLPQYTYLSQMHESLEAKGKQWLHGKEIYILAASLMQRLIGDVETLRPFLLVCMLAIMGAQILVYLIARHYWGERVGLWCYALFITCFWAYQYILFTGHQPLGLFFALLSVWCLLPKGLKKALWIWPILSGVCFGLAMYSSTIAPLYAPYVFAAFIFPWAKEWWSKKNTADIVKSVIFQGALVLVGFFAIFIYVNLPDVGGNIRSYFEYVEKSVHEQHSFLNQPILVQWFKDPSKAVFGGVIWIVKYFFLVMPILFPTFLACAGFLVWLSIRQWKEQQGAALLTLAIVLLCLTTPILGCIRQFAQYGRNYFTFLPGIICLIGYASYVLFQAMEQDRLRPQLKQMLRPILAIFFVMNMGVNAYLFFGDVYPTRMVTTQLSEIMEKLDVKRVATYMRHPHRVNLVDNLNPDVRAGITFVPISNINQVDDGYILVPPVTGNSIYRAAVTSFNDYEGDIFLNELIRRGTIDQYAVASFKTLTSSRFWGHEEEILSYKNLVLNHPFEDDLAKTKVWLLDAKKLKQDRGKNLPSSEYINLVKNNIRRIGTASEIYRFEGSQKMIPRPVVLNSLGLKLDKVGQPTDQLKAFVFKVDQDRPLWIPISDAFDSKPVNGSDVSLEASQIQFQFDEPLKFSPGRYRIVVYRTGEYSDENYYRIYQ